MPPLARPKESAAFGGDVSEVISKMLAEGVAVGRRFDTVERWMRVAIGTENEMARFQRAFEKVVG